MRFIVADWGTSRFRGYLVENETILDRVASDEGVSNLKAGEHQGVFLRQCGRWLAAEPSAPCRNATCCASWRPMWVNTARYSAG